MVGAQAGQRLALVPALRCMLESTVTEEVSMNAPITQPLLRWPAKVNEIPKEIFDREDLFQLELERIFYGAEWHPVAHAGELPLSLIHISEPTRPY